MDNKVSISKIKQGDLFEKLRMSFIIDRVSLIKAFRDIGINVRVEKDLDTLYKLNSKCLDRKG